MTENRYPRSGPVRGLLRRIRDGSVHRNTRRSLVQTVWAPARGPRGTCVWCGEPTENSRTSWHKACVRAYLIARGQTTKYAGSSLNILLSQDEHAEQIAFLRENPGKWKGMPHREKLRCALCEKHGGSEVDHRVSLAVARELRRLGDRNWWKAWTLQNLQSVCHECHVSKTKKDNALLRELRGEHRMLKWIMSADAAAFVCALCVLNLMLICLAGALPALVVCALRAVLVRHEIRLLRLWRSIRGISEGGDRC